MERSERPLMKRIRMCQSVVGMLLCVSMLSIMLLDV